MQAWYDGRPLETVPAVGGEPLTLRVPAAIITPHRAGVLALEIATDAAQAAFVAGPTTLRRGTQAPVTLDRWQLRIGGEAGPGFRDMPLPAQFGGPADSVVVIGGEVPPAAGGAAP
ncbi:MAG: hypothetical protein EBR86_03460 [Planctomycetia bacterium]|nr:hypothetical protein [Planctomycetia bacterium]